MSKENNAVIIFVKNMVKGNVKTRLAKDIGDDAAMDAYIQMQKHTLEITKNLDITRYLYYSDKIEDHDFWPSKHFHKMVQFGDGLGERMKHAFAYVSTFHDKTLIIGTDCLELSEEHLKKAIKTLNQYDLVIGPTDDGGYYLFGLKEFYASYFDDIEWSTDQVLEQTIRKAKKREASFRFLEQLNDIDYKSDWEQYLTKKKSTEEE